MESYKRYFQPKDFKIDWPNIPEAEVSYRRPPLTPEAAEEILGTRKPLESGKRLSKAASFLFGAVAAVALVPLEWQGLNRIFPIKTQPRISSSEGATRSRPTAPRQQERASEGSYDVNTGGFDEIGINNEEFSRDFMALMRPILPAGSYAIRYIDTPGDVIPDDYFGRSRRRHGEQAREDGYNRVLPNGERDIRVFKNGLEDDYGRFANVYELMRVLIHELIHSRESEELNYFVQRVKSQDRIRFPYPEEFLEARAEGKP